MRFKVEITMDNAAFEGDSSVELVRILRGVVKRLLAGESPPFGLMDTNGNRVGIAVVLR